MYNKLVAVGYLVNDPESRKVGDHELCQFRICASDKDAKDKCFIEVETWDKQASIAQKFLKKGRSVLIDGEIRLSTWEKNGQKHSRHYIKAASFKFLPSGGTNSKSDGSKTSSGNSNENSVDEDIPF